MGANWGRDQEIASRTRIRAAEDNDPNNPLIAEDITSTKNGYKNSMDVSNQEGMLSGVTFDYIARTLPSSTVERYTYKTGGSGGTTVAVVDVTYTDATLETILNVGRTT